MAIHEKLKQLSKNVETFEKQGDRMPLEKALDLYEESMKLTREISKMLDEAASKMTVEVIRADGTTEPFVSEKP